MKTGKIRKTIGQISWCASIALIALFASTPVVASENLRKVSVVFHWKAQAQWAGYYMAKEKGIYARYGIDATLMPRKGRSDSLDLLMDGRVTFATHFLSAGVGLRGAKQPVVLIGQSFNRSSLKVVAMQ